MLGELTIDVVMPKYSGNPFLDNMKTTDVFDERPE